MQVQIGGANPTVESRATEMVKRVLGGPFIEEQPAPVRGMGLFLPVILFVYPILALRRVYRVTWRGTIVRAIGVALLYLVAFALSAASLVLVAYWLA
ncbi:MAG: hypothetical protein ABR527_02905 [Gemmatimonadota bacterium]